MFTSCSVLFTTTTLSINSVSSNELSTFSFRGTISPLLHAPSAVITTFASASFIRSASASAENPPNTTECTAPILAQASIETTISGVIPR